MTRLSRLAPSFDAIRERLFALPRQAPAGPGAVVVSLMSRVGGEGVTSTAVGLARAVARGPSSRTLLIDYDTSRHGCANWLGVQAQRFAGWPAEAGGAMLADAVVEVDPGKLDLLTLDPGIPSGFAADAQWLAAFALLRSTYDVVLVDAGSMRQPLAQRWSRLADLRLLVVDTSRTTHEELDRLKIEWRANGQALDAVVLSKRDYPVPGFLYGHVR